MNNSGRGRGRGGKRSDSGGSGSHGYNRGGTRKPHGQRYNNNPNNANVNVNANANANTNNFNNNNNSAQENGSMEDQANYAAHMLVQQSPSAPPPQQQQQPSQQQMQQSPQIQQQPMQQQPHSPQLQAQPHQSPQLQSMPPQQVQTQISGQPGSQPGAQQPPQQGGQQMHIQQPMYQKPYTQQMYGGPGGYNQQFSGYNQYPHGQYFPPTGGYAGYPGGYQPMSHGYQSSQPPPHQAKPKSKAIAIIDPDTNEQIQYNKNKVEEAKKKKEEEKLKKEEEEEQLRKQKEEEERIQKEKEEEERKQKEEEERLRKEKEEEERKRKEEEERLRKEEEERKQKEEEERIRKEKEEEERKQKEEEERIRKEKEEEERKQKEEEERIRKEKEEEERKRKEEEERLRKEKEEEERKRKEEEERLRKEEEERKQKEEEERIRKEKEEEERKQKEEEERLRKEKEEEERLRKEKEEEERKKKEEEEKKKKRMEQRKRQDPLFGSDNNNDSMGGPDRSRGSIGMRSDSMDFMNRRAESPGGDNNMFNRNPNNNNNMNMNNSSNQPSPTPAGPIVAPTYAEGCWSPANPNGKKVYSFEFMFMFAQLVKTPPKGCQIKPEVNPEMYRQRQANRQNSRPEMNNQNRNQQGSRPGMQKNNSRNNNNQNNQNRQHHHHNNNQHHHHQHNRGFNRNNSRNNQPKPVYVGTEAGWKPNTLSGVKEPNDKNLTEEEKLEREDAKCLKQLMILLNKLSIEKYEKISTEICQLPVNSTKRLQEMIFLIFDKALDEPPYCAMYADLCGKLESYFQKKNEKEGKVIERNESFRWLLLKKCQNEFEKEVDGAYTLQAGVAAEDEDESVVRAKLKMIGNIKFVGELYKRSILSQKVMFSCINKLLCMDSPEYKDPSMESIECLHQLMFTVGKMLDTSQMASTMDKYFERIVKISTSKGVPIRYKFLMQDVIDLRKARWKARREEAGPKKMDEVQKDAVKAKAEKAQNAQAQRQHSHGGGHNSRSNTSNGQMSTNEWSTVVPSRKQQPTEAGKKLMPMGGFFGMGGRLGASGGSQNSGKPTSQPSNAFAMLEQGGRRDSGGGLQPQYGRQGQRTPSPNQPMRGGYNSRPGPGQGRPTQQTRAPAPAPAPIDLEKTKKITRAIFEEYCELNDFDEALYTLDQEVKNPAAYHAVAECLIAHNMTKQKVYKKAIDLLVKLCGVKKVTASQFYKGFNAALSAAAKEELHIDAPKLFSNLGEYLGTLILEGHCTFEDFIKHLSADEPNNDDEQGRLVAEAIKFMKSKDKEIKMEIDWKKYIYPETPVEEFLKRVGL